MRSDRRPVVVGCHDEPTGSIPYVVSDPATRACAIVNPVLNFDRRSGAGSTRWADRLLEHIARQHLHLEGILDTHPHADHLSAAGTLKDRTGVQKLWKAIYGLPDSFPVDGSQWDRLFSPGDVFRIGDLEGRILFSPGHTMCSFSCRSAMPPSSTTRCSCPTAAASVDTDPRGSLS